MKTSKYADKLPDERKPTRRINTSSKRSKTLPKAFKEQAALTQLEAPGSVKAMAYAVRDAADGLTSKQVKWLISYMDCGNATEAALTAGWSETSASAIGAGLLALPQVQLAISTFQNWLMSSTGIDRSWVIQRLGLESVGIGKGCTAQTRVRALETLAKILGILSDQITHTHTGHLSHTAGHIHVDASLLPPELVQRLYDNLPADPSLPIALPVPVPALEQPTEPS